MTEKVPNFYFDLIARIAPGSLALVFICRSQLEKALKDQNFSQAVIVTFVGIIVAYILGYILETCSGLLDWIYCKLHPSLRKWTVRLAKGTDSQTVGADGGNRKRQKWLRLQTTRLCANFLPSQELWKYYAARGKKSQPTEQLFDFKEMAERVLFRTLWMMSFLALVVAICLPSLLEVTEFPIVQSPYFLLTAFLLIGVTFLKIWYFSSQRVNTAKTEPCPCGGGNENLKNKKLYEDCCGKDPEGKSHQ